MKNTITVIMQTETEPKMIHGVKVDFLADSVAVVTACDGREFEIDANEIVTIKAFE